MTSFAEKSRKARKQRMEKQVSDYNIWLDGFMKTRAWTYFKKAFDVGVVEEKNKELEQKYVDRLLNRMLQGIFFSKRSSYRLTNRYESAKLDIQNKENAEEALQAINIIQKIRNRAGFKTCGIEQFARQDLFLWLNDIGELTHELIDNIEGNPDNFVASDKLDILDKVFSLYQVSLNDYLNNNTEMHFNTFHCITFSEPVPLSKIKKTIDTDTALMIYFHDLMSRSVSFQNGNGYPREAQFCTIKGVGWTVPAKLVLAAITEKNMTEEIEDPILKKEVSELVDKTKDKAKKFVRKNKNFSILSWNLNYDHS